MPDKMLIEWRGLPPGILHREKSYLVSPRPHQFHEFEQIDFGATEWIVIFVAIQDAHDEGSSFREEFGPRTSRQNFPDFLAVKVVLDLHSGRMSNPIQRLRSHIRAWLGMTQGMGEKRTDPEQAVDEIRQRSALVQETSLAIDNQFRNSGDRGGEHNLPVRHRFHENQRNTFAAAR